MTAKRWTEVELARLNDAAESYRAMGLSFPAYMRRLQKEWGLSFSRLYAQLREAGFQPHQPDQYYTLREVASLLGIKETTIRNGVTLGRFKPHIRASKRKIMRQIKPEVLYKALTDQRIWHLYDPTKITDLAWREELQECRAGWLTPAQVAEILLCSQKHVGLLRRRGKLPGVSLNRKVAWYRVEDVQALRAQMEEQW